MAFYSRVICEYFCGNFHFAPPLIDEGEKMINLQKSLYRLHLEIGRNLKLETGHSCVDIGCGVGGVIEHLERTGANFLGFSSNYKLKKIENMLVGVTIRSETTNNKIIHVQATLFLQNIFRFSIFILSKQMNSENFSPLD